MRLLNYEANQALDALFKLQQIKMPVKVSIDVALLMNEIENGLKPFGNVRDKLFKTYSVRTEPGEDPGITKFISTEQGKEEENLRAFMEEFEELLNSKTEELTINKIKLPDNLEIEPAILKPLTKMIEL